MAIISTKIIRDNKEFNINDILLDSPIGRRLYLESIKVTDMNETWKKEDLTGYYYVIDVVDRISYHRDIIREITIV